MPGDVWERKRLFLRHTEFKKASLDVQRRKEELLRTAESLPFIRLRELFDSAAPDAGTQKVAQQLSSKAPHDVQGVHRVMNAASSRKAFVDAEESAFNQVRAMCPGEPNEFLKYYSQTPRDGRFEDRLAGSKLYQQFNKARREYGFALGAIQRKYESLGHEEARILQQLDEIPALRRAEHARATAKNRDYVNSVRLEHEKLDYELQEDLDYERKVHRDYLKSYREFAIYEGLPDLSAREKREIEEMTSGLLRNLQEAEKRVQHAEQEAEGRGGLAAKMKGAWDRASARAEKIDRRFDERVAALNQELADIREQRFGANGIIAQMRRQANAEPLQRAAEMYSIVKADIAPSGENRPELAVALERLRSAQKCVREFDACKEAVDSTAETFASQVREHDLSVAREQRAKAWLEDLGENGVAAKTQESVPAPYSFGSLRLRFQRIWNYIFNGGVSRTDEELQAFRAGESLRSGLPIQPREPVAYVQPGEDGVDGVDAQLPNGIQEQGQGPLAEDAPIIGDVAVDAVGGIPQVDLPAHAQGAVGEANAIIGEGVPGSDIEDPIAELDQDPNLQIRVTSGVAPSSF
jgi:hypothetical protein